MSTSMLLDAYRALPEGRRQLLQVLGVCESTISLAMLLELLRACGWAKAETKSGVLTQALLKPELTELRRQGLVESMRAGMARVQIAAPFLDFAVQRAVLEGSFRQIARAVTARHTELSRELKHEPAAVRSAAEPRRRARIAFYSGDVAGFRTAMQDLAGAKAPLNNPGLLNPFDAEVLQRIPVELQPDALVPAVERCLLTAVGTTEVIDAFRAFVQRHGITSGSVGEVWVNLLVAAGDLRGLAELASGNTTASNSAASTAAAGCLAFLKGEAESAETAFARLTDGLRKSAGRRKVVLPPLPGLLRLLLVLRRNDPQGRETLKSFVSAATDQWPAAWKTVLEIVTAAATYSSSPDAVSRSRLKSTLSLKPARAWAVVQAVAAHLGHWYLPEEALEWTSGLADTAAEYDEFGLKWLAALCEDGAAGKPDTARAEAVGGRRHGKIGTHPMLSWIQPTSLWKRKLDSLRQVADGKPAAAPAQPASNGYDERMIWELDARATRDAWRAELRPMLQKFSRGTWTKGRPVALERLFRDHRKPSFAFLTEQDHAVCECIEESQISTGYYRYTETVYHLAFDQALPRLIGHPLLFPFGDRSQSVELVSVTPSRFVPLSDGRFFALTEQLRQRVAELASYAENRNGRLRFPPIRAAALSDLDEWCSLRADRHWKACLKRIRDAGEIEVKVPSTLNAELRDYQTDGFRWLCRLAHWGAGACLADDMGLGKTLQAIAMLLHRGAGGPALVIAPTSVCFNWESELQRFAPTLTPRLFGVGDRDAFLAELGPRDVVITSYGLLHTETERLQAVQWHTAVLDEAQAIKNTLTKRSQAAMSLTADFRLIMTGTPVENHLGELWNLFQFINPGLLGSHEHYQQQFALPIERDQDRDVRQRLKRLVQPFLLRRTKTQVLSELPPRIEVTVPVSLSDEEALLYEAARQRAVQQLTEHSDARGRHVRILAEIMRLRRACCHPSLVLPSCGLPGAKLTVFSETIDELLANRHKALVFSQFVDHLAILRAELDRKGVAYQYLDGSTPTRERQRSVSAFQDGEGDVFLISLKAGGTGLNLTAADYVLHMDPWWNPAVEDQAADRAHRLGQRRPVTIYRFITRNTIEEKILALHATKRDLADSLLEGADTSGRLSAEELLALIR